MTMFPVKILRTLRLMLRVQGSNTFVDKTSNIPSQALTVQDGPLASHFGAS
jgi:hypothetical protein